MIPSCITLARRQQQILVVDDAASTRALLAFYLEEAGYTVWTAANGQEALAGVDKRGLPQLALLDLHLRDLPGPMLARLLNRQGKLPLLFLGTCTTDRSTVNPADLLIKPIVADQLLSAVQQRLPDGDTALLALQEVRVDSRLTINFAERYAILSNRRVELSVAESVLLEQLWGHQGRVLTHDFLHDQIRTADPYARSSVVTYIYSLRQKLESHPAHRRYIRNVQGQGYFMPITPAERPPAVPIVIPRRRRILAPK